MGVMPVCAVLHRAAVIVAFIFAKVLLSAGDHSISEVACPCSLCVTFLGLLAF